MFIDRKTHRQLRLQHYLFLVLMAAIVISLAWLSTRYKLEADWTSAGRNSLSDASTALLASLSDQITIDSYAREEDGLRQHIRNLIARYQRHKSDITLIFNNPDLMPDKVRELGISSNGELVIRYQGRHENVKSLSEQAITNALQRLARSGEPWLVFLTGHGERLPMGQANHDLSAWVSQLETKGFKAQTHNLASQPRLPDNTRALIIASPQLELLPGETQVIQTYLANGGNLLWLLDPDARHGESLLQDSLGITLQAGTVVDPGTQLLGISDPRFALVSDYGAHAITRDFDTITLFPQAMGLSYTDTRGWLATHFLNTHTRSWSETGSMTGSIGFDNNRDIQGPLNLGIALQRSVEDSGHSQRVVVIADGDFLSNAYLGNGGNLKLGMNIINWLSHDDDLLNIPVIQSVDSQLQLSTLAQGAIAIGFLIVIPLLLAVTGAIIWWHRRLR